jgi:hypothetical protein
MNEPAMQPGWTRAARVALAATALACSTACNVISGADAVEFKLPGGAGGSGNAGGGGSEAGGGGSGGDGDGGDGGGAGGSSVPGCPDEGVTPFGCNVNDVAVGVYGFVGSWFDQFGLICAPLRPDGTPNDNVAYKTPLVGVEGGSPLDNQLCNSGEVMVSLSSSQEGFTDGLAHMVQMQFDCRPASAMSDPPTFSTVGPFGGNAMPLPATFDDPRTCSGPGVIFGVDFDVNSDGSLISVKSVHCCPAQ